MTQTKPPSYTDALKAFDAATDAVKGKSLPLCDEDKAKIESCIADFVQAKDGLSPTEKFGEDFIYDSIDVSETAQTLGIDARKILTGKSCAPA